jgi:hypothetical protein
MKNGPGFVNGIIRRWDPRAIRLGGVDATTAGGGASRSVGFRVPTPDARVMVKVAVLYSAVNAQVSIPFDITRGGELTSALWLAGAERTVQGTLEPITNLVGTSAAPQVIPTDTGIMGYSQTYFDVGDAIIGRLTVTDVSDSGGPALAIHLQTRYQPVAGAVLCDDEWAAIVAQCRPESVDTEFQLGPSL